MSAEREETFFISLVHELRRLPGESEWVEFKHNQADPEDVGEYISALANSAALLGKAKAYVIWGIDDQTHEVVGTRFVPGARKVGNEELENWLLRLLSPKIDFCFHPVIVDENPVVLLEIGPAFRHPVRFKNLEFIRIGTYKKKLKNFPEKERALWRALDHTPFESGVASEHIEGDDVLRLLDAPAYFDLLELPLPDGRIAILEALRDDNIIQPCDAGGWNITNLGAILFAKKLSNFGGLGRKAMRVVLYTGKGRIETQREQVGTKGYACGFEGLIDFIMALIPANEVIEKALRKSVPMYPELAVRELVANALIHQDFFATGTGPMVELFEDRVEITNPGEPLVSTERFVDTPPKSRNEALASMMRRFRICEERGSGIDKVVSQTEIFQLPAPLFEAPAEFTRTVLFSHRPLTKMGKEDRIRACYLHACLKYVQRDFLTNTSLRERFSIEEKNRSVASRLIKEATEVGMIAPYDPSAAPKMMKYVPWWAVPEITRN